MSIPVIGDPHHEIREDLKARGWIDIFYNEDYGHLRAREWANHPNGYYQPATIAIHKSGRVLYRWRCVPKFSNMSGAGGRPEARYTWESIKAFVTTADALPSEDMPADRDPEMGARDLSWPHFLLIMTAHGWFLRPKAFPLLREGGKDALSPTTALRRWYVFGALWLLALVLFPTAWVATAACVWVVALIPGLVEIHRQFQNEPDAY